MTDFRIISPCAADWNAMTPAAAGRHCAECGKDVIDVTCLKPAAREFAFKRLELALVSGRKVCVRSHAEANGRVTAQSLKRRVLTGGMATILAMSISGCQGVEPTVETARPAPVSSVPVAAPPPSPENATPTSETPIPVRCERPIRMGDFAVEPLKNELLMGKMCIEPLPLPTPAPAPAPAPVPQPTK